MMKKRLTAALLAAGLLLAGCTADRGAAPPSGSGPGGASQTGTVDHTPEELLAWEALPAEVQELLRGYGAFSVRQPAKRRPPDCYSTPAG